jgi:L-ornithine N5-monooxygenase
MKIYDFIGIGFGPANLSVAVAMEEYGLLPDGLEVAFIESKPEFIWHGDMLLPDAEMQISFFKDLAMLRKPTSKFTFLNYLAQKGRLESFANLKRFFPRRVEYNDYLKWAAEQFKDYVSYGEKVTKIEPFKDANEGAVKYLAVHKQCNVTGETSVMYAKNVSLATGISKKLPENVDVTLNDTIIHSNDFLRNLSKSFDDKNAHYKFIVVGSGQSAVEITMHLAEEYPNSKVDLCFRGYALKPADETEFVNEIFGSEATEEFQNYSEKLRKQVLNAHRDTNYSVTDPELITALYERLYFQKINGSKQITINHFHELMGVDEERNLAKFDNIKEERHSELPFDGLFLATGYEPRMVELLQGFENYLVYDAPNRLALDENYVVKTKTNGFLPKLFVQGASEYSHGLGETLLSLLAYRSARITDQLSCQESSMAV